MDAKKIQLQLEGQSNMKKYNCLYFADVMGDIQDEGKTLKERLNSEQIKTPCFKIEDTPQEMFNGNYDILFFDYGGISIGNSLLEHFCSSIIELAEKYPSRYFCMVSQFTEYAMKELLEGMGMQPHNIYFDIEKLIMELKNA